MLHFLFSGSETGRSLNELAETLRSNRFTVDLEKCREGVIAEERREVASENFDSLTVSLTDLARDAGWTYDGWECSVETGEGNAH